MNTSATERRTDNGRISKAVNTIETITEAGLDLGLLKKKLENAVEETMLDAERLVRQGKRGVEDAMDDTAYWIKKNPWQSVGYVFGAGLGLGILSGWLLGRRR